MGITEKYANRDTSKRSPYSIENRKYSKGMVPPEVQKILMKIIRCNVNRNNTPKQSFNQDFT
jgi:hypothetical protein